ncbi:hypothetical protein VKT23_015100 [Stygiomarasmius scandens]|uniref:Uncharacterized protein n=1 Tax=Marasmiellus scandens TaxID=2682957 RepID=A0ABR1J352_9AGAR
MIIKTEDFSTSSMASTSAASLKAEEAKAEVAANSLGEAPPPAYDDVARDSDFHFIRPQPRTQQQQEQQQHSTLRPPLPSSNSAPAFSHSRHSSYVPSPPHSPHSPPSLPSSSTLTLVGPHQAPSLPSSSTLTLVPPSLPSSSTLTLVTPSLPSSSTQTLVPKPNHIRHASHSPRSKTFPDKDLPERPSIDLTHRSSSSTSHTAPVFVPKKRGFFGGKEKQAKEAKEWVISHVNDLVRQTHNYDLNACSSILGACTEACTLTSKLFLSDVLQESFIDDHTPFYWSIIHRPLKSRLVPDLLVALLTFGSPLTNATRADIRHACLMVNDQKLFQHLRSSRKYMPKRMPELIVNDKHPFDEIRVQEFPGAEAVFTADFEMPMFVKRMHLEQEVSLEFIAHRRAWHLHFKPASKCQPSSPLWDLSLSISEFSSPTFVDSRFSILEPTPSPSSSPSHSALKMPRPSLGNGIDKHPKPSPSMPNLLSLSSPNANAVAGSSLNGRGTSRAPGSGNNTVRGGSPNPSPTSPNGPAGSGPGPRPGPLMVRIKSSSITTPGKKDITVSLEDGCEIGAAVRAQNSSYISRNGTLRGRFEARLAKPESESSCVIC